MENLQMGNWHHDIVTIVVSSGVVRRWTPKLMTSLQLEWMFKITCSYKSIAGNLNKSHLASWDALVHLKWVIDWKLKIIHDFMFICTSCILVWWGAGTWEGLIGEAKKQQQLGVMLLLDVLPLPRILFELGTAAVPYNKGYMIYNNIFPVDLWIYSVSSPFIISTNTQPHFKLFSAIGNIKHFNSMAMLILCNILHMLNFSGLKVRGLMENMLIVQIFKRISEIFIVKY